MLLFFFLSLVCFFFQVQSFKVEKDNEGSTTNAPVLASMKWSTDAGFSVVEDYLTTSIDTVAWLNYTNAINATGWSYLEIKTDHRFPDKIQVSIEILILLLPKFYMGIRDMYMRHNNTTKLLTKLKE